MVEDLLVFAAVGFAAQMIDGAIGMAYGLSATSVLLTLGVAPATASASVPIRLPAVCAPRSALRTVGGRLPG
jgi:uncharacterized membrane protein YfcA